MKTAKEKGYLIKVRKRIDNARSKIAYCREFIADKNGFIRVCNEDGFPHYWEFNKTELY